MDILLGEKIDAEVLLPVASMEGFCTFPCLYLAMARMVIANSVAVPWKL